MVQVAEADLPIPAVDAAPVADGHVFEAAGPEAGVEFQAGEDLEGGRPVFDLAAQESDVAGHDVSGGGEGEVSKRWARPQAEEKWRGLGVLRSTDGAMSLGNLLGRYWIVLQATLIALQVASKGSVASLGGSLVNCGCRIVALS